MKSFFNKLKSLINIELGGFLIEQILKKIFELSELNQSQCHSCGNVICKNCLAHLATVLGIESEGLVEVCNLCNYGQVNFYKITFKKC